MADAFVTLIPLLGSALLHFLWQGALIGLLAAIALQLLQSARPQVRYAVACIALLASALAPAITLVMMVGNGGNAGEAAVGLSAPVVAATVSPAAPLIAAWPLQLYAAMPWIVALWAAGACTLSLRMAVGLAWIRRLRATPQGPAHAPWQARLDALAIRFGMTQPIALRLVDGLDSPASAGWWRPMVVLPTALLTRMPTDLIEALLAHELAHIRRHDYLVNLLQGVVEALLFYHPVTWWLSRRIRIEREHIADQLATQVTGEPRRLALALSELSDLNRSCQPHPQLAQAAHGGHLMSRIEQLVRPDRRAAGGRIAFPLIGLAAACLAFYAHAQIGQGTPATKPQTQQQQGAVKPQASARQVTRLHNDDTRDAYALISKGRDGITMSGSTDDLPAIESARRSFKGSDFVWFRRDDKAYVIVDPAMIARVQQAWRESNRIGAQMEALGRQMEVHGDKMEALGQQMEQLAPSQGNTAAMDAASRRMESLGEQQAALGAKQAKLAAGMTRADDAGREELSRALDVLSEQQDALGQQMDQQARIMDAEGERMEARTAPMEALGRQMEEAGKPMEALGSQMEALGTQHEKAVAQVEREMDKLIGEAMSKGLALAAPSYSKQ